MSEIETKDAIIRELVRAAARLGAKSDLLGVACSYGDTYDDEQVLSELRFWNEVGHFPAPLPIEKQIRHEIYRAMTLLGAESDLLGTVGSWGNSLPDNEVLHGLRQWNAATEKDRGTNLKSR